MESTGEGLGPIIHDWGKDVVLECQVEEIMKGLEAQMRCENIKCAYIVNGRQR